MNTATGTNGHLYSHSEYMNGGTYVHSNIWRYKGAVSNAIPLNGNLGLDLYFDKPNVNYGYSNAYNASTNDFNVVIRQLKFSNKPFNDPV